MHDIFLNVITPEIQAAKAARKAKLFKYADQSRDEAKIDFLLSVSYDLTPLGFDYFIAYFLEKHFGYKMFVVDGFRDGGIDIKGSKALADGSREHIAVQCKRWNVYSINELEMAAFYGRVADIVHAHKCLPFYATTNYLTANAKVFADDHGITYVDFDSIMEMRDYVSADEFLDYLRKHALEASRLNNQKEQIQMLIDTNAELFDLLRRVRMDLARKLRVPPYAVAKDSMLCEFVRHKPRTASDLLGVGGFGTVRTQKYGAEFAAAIDAYVSSKKS